ncbi:MAG: ParB/RepB/Spo0J family partition protein, partial [Kiritimatiellae bacterium]|nr:ParB/RepB/Spo0J family partition protein [Kiritimatiellia bacterium]
MEEQPEVAGHVFALPVESIHRSPYQVRRDAKADPDLKASIAAHGLVHPITVREDGMGGYELIAGHRRLASYREALPGAPIPATVLSVGDREAEDLLVSENFMRLDLSLVEKAVTIARLKDHGRSTAQVAELVRMSERQVYRFLAIGTLAQPWREFLHAWNATYEEALRLARLPKAVQESAWSAFFGYLADALCYTVRKGNKEDEQSRGTFIAGLEGSADDKAAFLDYLVR